MLVGTITSICLVAGGPFLLGIFIETSAHVPFFVSHYGRRSQQYYSRLLKKRSLGHDQRTVSLVKEIAFTIAATVSHIVNTSFHTRTYSDAFKNAKMTPIFKRGEKIEPGN